MQEIKAIEELVNVILEVPRQIHVIRYKKIEQEAVTNPYYERKQMGFAAPLVKLHSRHCRLNDRRAWASAAGHKIRVRAR